MKSAGQTYVVCVFAIYYLFNICSAFESQSLSGNWKLSDTAGKYNALNAQVPGGIYSDLMNNNIIADIFYGSNDVETRWVAQQTWNYTRMFDAKTEILQQKHVILIFEGVDTFSSVYLNGKQIGTTDNMFVRYEFDIDGLLKVTENILTIIFESPITKSQLLYDKQAKNYPVPPKCVPGIYNGECHVNHIRKMQASFAWDWGPAFPSVGLWKNVYLNAYDETYIKDITVAVNTDNSDYYKFTVTTFAAPNAHKKLQGVLKVSISNIAEADIVNFDLDETLNDKEFVIKRYIILPRHRFELWWPNGFGEQNLYPFTVIIQSNGETVTKTMKIGIRDVKLVQTPIGKGSSFHFKVNGVPIFAKGSNMVPSHILPEHSNNETLIRKIMQNAKDVHMNMIRIWGGGLYEADILYELADEMGIMIWQDFMFACSMYPANSEFLSTVQKEVEHQVKRLQYHPSLVLWAGNNENEAALRFNWYGTIFNQSTYETDYRQLYGKTIRDVVLKYDPSGTYLSSSPTNGVKSEEEGFIAKNPQDNAYGDVHFYNYLLDSWNINIYPIPRFASEYGYQALPSYRSMKTATNDDSDLYIGSKFMIHRQHHPLGFTEMEYLIKSRLTLPTKSNTLSYNVAFLYYSQIIQAMAIKIETEHYRQWRSYLNSEGYGMTMGALYWQLNCPWIAPTWSSVDSTGKWKMLHYYAKDFFAPVIVSPHQYINRTVDIFVVSDLLEPIFNASLKISIFNWNSLTSVNEKVRPVDVLTGSLRITKINLNSFLTRNAACAADYSDCFVRLSLTNDSGAISPDNYIFPVPLKNAPVLFANVQIEQVVGMSNRKFLIHVTTDMPAAFVWLESSLDGQFSENGFMLVEQRKEILFEREEASNTADVLNSLQITHLKDKFYFLS